MKRTFQVPRGTILTGVSIDEESVRVAAQKPLPHDTSSTGGVYPPVNSKQIGGGNYRKKPIFPPGDDRYFT